jgi:hypothetical protein
MKASLDRWVELCFCMTTMALILAFLGNGFYRFVIAMEHAQDDVIGPMAQTIFGVSLLFVACLWLRRYAKERRKWYQRLTLRDLFRI